MIDSLSDQDIERLLGDALSAAKADDFEAARILLDRLVRSRPSLVKGWINYGSVCAELNLVEEAERAYRQALDLDPASPQAASSLGALLRESGRLAEAEAALRATVTRSPDFVFAHYNLGHTFFLAGRFDEAAAAYREGLRADPQESANQSARLSWALLAAGKTKEARRELKRSLERMPRDESEALDAEALEVLDAIAAAKPELADAIDSLRRMVAQWRASGGGGG